MQDYPIFSIIITTLNGERTIEKCLRSIKCQSYKKFELIIVDGGSTDRTAEIIKESDICRLKFEIVPGIGLYAGLNYGVKLSLGKWLYFMGCDDVLFDEDTLAKVVSELQTADSQVKIIAGNVVYSESGYRMVPSFGIPYLLNYRLHHQGTFYHSSLFKRRMYNESLYISADYEFNLYQAIEKTSYKVIDIDVSIYAEKGVSSLQYKKNFQEIQSVNKRVFVGSQRLIAVGLYSFSTKVWLIRNRLGLLNLKQKWSSLIKRIA